MVPLSLCSSAFVLRPCIFQQSVDSIAKDASNCMMLDQLFILGSHPGCCSAIVSVQVFKEFLFAVQVEKKQETTESPAACQLFAPSSLVWTYDANNFIFELKNKQTSSNCTSGLHQSSNCGTDYNWSFASPAVRCPLTLECRMVYWWFPIKPQKISCSRQTKKWQMTLIVGRLPFSVVWKYDA